MMSNAERPGHFEGEPDPGCLRYYARMTEHRKYLNSALLPIGGRVSYVEKFMGGLSVIWHFGKRDTGFSSGTTVDDVLSDIHHNICGGL